VPFPSPPWSLSARAWLSVFALRATGRPDRPPGLYGVALVDYGEPGVLTYHELLVARLLREGRTPRVRVTDIWVDSAVSREGGRALWAIPKQLADLPMTDTGVGPLGRTSFNAVAEGRHVASGTFTSLPAAARVRTPFGATLSQEREDGPRVLTPWTGSARSLPCRATWTFDEDGPLAFLRGRRSLASFRLVDARLRFG
jgi:hypothetical protein